MIARYSQLTLLVLLVALAGLFVGLSLRDPYSDPPVALEVGWLALLLLFGLHLWYFRREWEQMRRGWVERRPWLRYVVRTEPQPFRRSIVQALGGFALLLVLLTVWLLEVATLELFLLAAAVFAGAIVWQRTRDPAQAIAYGAAVVLIVLAFIVFLMLLSSG
jgi:hypothetical protein